jgi:LPXTG-motif cell wall-anchored protein
MPKASTSRWWTALIAGWWVLAVPAAALAQAPAPDTGSSSAPGILAVLGAAALLATGIYFWVRGEDDPPESDADDPVGQPPKDAA